MPRHSPAVAMSRSEPNSKMAVSTKQSFKEMFDCKLCGKHYNEPRNLHCAHPFCTHCLSEITVVDDQGGRTISCPVCHLVTELTSAQAVHGLPKSHHLSHLQEEISKCLESAPTGSEGLVMCKWCPLKASHRCLACAASFCDKCTTDVHVSLDGVAGHRAIPIRRLCTRHQNEKAVLFCIQCSQFICANCVMGDHRSHQVQRLETAAEECRLRVLSMMNAGCSVNKEEKQAQRLSNALTDAKNRQQSFRNSSTHIRHLLAKFVRQFDQMEKETEDKMALEIKQLAQREDDAKRLIKCKHNLIELATPLMQVNDDATLIEKVTNLPLLDTLGTVTNLCSGSVTLPPKSDVLKTVKTSLTHTMNGMNIRWDEFPINDPLVLGSARFTVDVGSAVSGLVMDTTRQRIVARTLDTKAPIKLLDYSGRIVEEFGGDIAGLGGTEWRTIGIDTRRGMYLVPCHDSLKLLDMKGREKIILKIAGDLRGVAYCDQTDRYVISNITTHQVSILDANTRKLIAKFGAHGSENKELNNPYNLCVGYFSGIRHPAIAVSDKSNHRVNVFSTSGEYIKSYGCPGSGDLQLNQPWAVAADPAGRLVVSDWQNQRVVAFWEVDGKPAWCCYVHQSYCAEDTRCVSIDKSARVMAIGINNHITLLAE